MESRNVLLGRPGPSIRPGLIDDDLRRRGGSRNGCEEIFPGVGRLLALADDEPGEWSVANAPITRLQPLPLELAGDPGALCPLLPLDRGHDEMMHQEGTTPRGHLTEDCLCNSQVPRAGTPEG